MRFAERKERRPSDLSVEVQTPSGTLRADGRVKNLSDEGLCLEHELNVPPGAHIGVEIPPAGDRGRITILGEVRWANGKVAGIQVAAMVPHHRHRYRHLLSSLESVLAPGGAVTR